jgi:hypothetical protein
VSTVPTAVEAAAPESRLPLGQRLLVHIISWAGYLAIRLIGPTLRITISAEDGETTEQPRQGVIYAFWHRCVFPATWFFRDQGIAVLTSRSADGEYIARIIERFGYVAVRGSSSRGAVAGLIGMHRELKNGRVVAFTIDGPRGPRYVAKPGPLSLARKTGTPVVAFHIALDHPWTLRSWDAFMVPRPFSRAHVRVSAPISVARHADEAEMERCHAELQAALDRVRIFADSQVPTPG